MASGYNSYSKYSSALGSSLKANNAAVKQALYIGHRNSNNVFNPMEMDGSDPMPDCCEEVEKERTVTLKFFPSKDQFELIKLYYLDRRVDMSITSIFELTDKQFKELLEVHMKELNDTDKYTKETYISRLRDFYRYFYRDSAKERKDLIKLLKTIDIEPDMNHNGDDMIALNTHGITDAEHQFVNLFDLLLSNIPGTREERLAQKEKYYEDILIPKFDNLASKGMIGKRWWLAFESEFKNFSVDFIKKYLTRFSGKFLLTKRFEYSDLRENPEIKDIIKQRLEENIKDELGIHGIKDDLITIDVDFDLDQVSLFKYLEEDSRYDGDDVKCDGY